MSTIAAIATPLGEGGLSVIRISGEDALAIAAKVFSPLKKRSIASMHGYTACYGHVHFPVKGGLFSDDIDEAVLLVFRAPHSYTGEDVVELSCHGGVFITKQLLRAVLEAGAELAQPGEFTKRAFLSGKLSLTQAEAVADIISAQSKQAADAAFAVKEGALYARIEGITAGLMGVAAQLAAWIDFPEEDTPAVETAVLLPTLMGWQGELAALLSGYDTGRILREGVDTVIVGRPNVGKSTLMNLLAGFPRSIVTDVAGTTRDIVEESVLVAGVRLRLADTAGLRDTADTVESIGVAMAKQRLDRAGLILAVFDGSERLSDDDRSLLDSIGERPCIAIVNKSDLPMLLDTAYIEERCPTVVTLSAREGTNTAALTNAVAEVLRIAKLDTSAGILANERQRTCAVRASEYLADAISSLAAGFSLDAVSVSVDVAMDALLELSGKRISAEIVDEVFARFCVGK